MEVPQKVSTNRDLVTFLEGIRARAAGRDVQTELSTYAAEVDELCRQAQEAPPENQITEELQKRVRNICSIL